MVYRVGHAYERATEWHRRHPDLDTTVSKRKRKLMRTRIRNLCCALRASASAHAQEWKPERNVEIIVPTAAGGGNDKTARILQKLWQEMGLQTTVANRTGGGGAVAYTYLSQRTADPHHLAIAQAGLFTNNITGKSPIQYTDFTVLANLGIEPSAIAVRTESPIKSGRELFDRLKQDPSSVSISIGSTTGGTSHMALGRAIKAMGGDPKKLKTVVVHRLRRIGRPRCSAGTSTR